MPLLAYWNIRGLAQPIRLLLVYAGETYDEKLYDEGPAPEYNIDMWVKDKFALGMDFPNLPYYFDGDLKLTQSNAIMRYIARKHKLDGSTEQEKVLVDMMAEEAMDFRNAFVNLCYSDDFDKLKAAFLEKAKTKVEQFETFLGNKDFFAGKNITFVDFLMYELLDQHKCFEPELLKDAPQINAFLTRFEDLPAIKQFMSSDKFMKRPINMPSCNFS